MGVAVMVVASDLSSFPFFNCFEAGDIKTVVQYLEKKTLLQGSDIFHMGDQGDHMFFVQKGGVDVILDVLGREKFIISSIEEGDFFGEMALLDDSTRAATVIARENMELLSLHRRDFFTIYEHYPATANLMLRTIGRSLSERLRLLDEHFLFTEGTLKTLHTLKEKGEYHDRYPDIAMARAYELELIDCLVNLGEHQTFESGETIIREGEFRQELYVILKGTAEVIKNMPDSEQLVIAALPSNTVFGEMSFLDREARSAEVRSCESMEVIVCSSDKLASIAQSDITLLNKLYLNILRRQCLNIRLTNKLYHDSKQELIDLTTFPDDTFA